MDFVCALRRWVSLRHCVCITGAGISVSAGIPDFRSKDGIYQLLSACTSSSAATAPGFSEPQEIFDLSVFNDEPELLYAMAPRIFAPLWLATPSISHNFLVDLFRLGRLKRVYTQNVDGLEAQAGVPTEIMVMCHGSLASATCMRCGRRLSCSNPGLRRCLEGGTVATCRGTGGACPEVHQTADGWACGSSTKSRGVASRSLPLPILKPDAVFFREPLPAAFHAAVAQDFPAVGARPSETAPAASAGGKADAATSDGAHAPDACLVMGSRLAVRPVADLPHRLPATCWRVLINRERLAPAKPATRRPAGRSSSSFLTKAASASIDSPAVQVGSKRPRGGAGSSSAIDSSASASGAAPRASGAPIPPAFDAEFIGEADVITAMLLRVLEAQLPESKHCGGDAAGAAGASAVTSEASASLPGSGCRSGAAASEVSAHVVGAADGVAATFSAALGSFGFISVPGPGPGRVPADHLSWHVHGHGACVRNWSLEEDHDHSTAHERGESDESVFRVIALSECALAAAQRDRHCAHPTEVDMPRP